MSEPLLEIRGLSKRFPIHSGLSRRVTGEVRAIDGVDLTIMRGETLGLVGESGCGKSTTGRAILRAIEPTEGEILFHDRAGTVDVAKLGPRRAQAHPAPYADGVPGSLCLAQPAHECRGAHRRAADLPRAPHAQAAPRPGGRAARAGGAQCQLPAALPAHLFRWPAPAHRHRPRAGAGTRFRRLRRGGIGPRCVGAGAGAEPVERHPGAAGHHLPVHLARSRRHRTPVRPGGGDVSGPDRRVRRNRSAAPHPEKCPMSRPCSRPSPNPIRMSGASGWRSAAKSPTPPTGRPAARSIRAVRMPRRCARARSRRCGRSRAPRARIWRRATLPRR